RAAPAAPDPALGGGAGRLRDRPPVPVRRGHGRDPARGDRPCPARRERGAGRGRPVPAPLPGHLPDRRQHPAGGGGRGPRPGQGDRPADRDRVRGMLPPKLVRRLILAPLVLVVTVALLVLLPGLVILAAAASPLLPGRWRALRLLWFGLVWLAMESVALFACLALWVASGFGGRLGTEEFLDRHYDLIPWGLAVCFRVGTA